MRGVRELALRYLAPELAHERHRPLEHTGDPGLDSLGVARQLARHPESDPAKALARGELDAAVDAGRRRVAAVPPGEGAEQQGGVGDAAGQRPALVER